MTDDMTVKKKKILFLFANDFIRKGLCDPESLNSLMSQASDKLEADMEFYFSYARSLSFFISNNKVKIRDHRNHMDLEEYDFVYFRKAGTAIAQMLTCALYLKDKGIPFFDREIAETTSRNKLSQMYMLRRNSLPIPKTLFCRNNRRLARLVEKRYVKDFQFPLIVKATGGSRGDANYLVKSIDELKEIVSNEKRHFMIQEFIPNEGDIRFFIAGGGLKGSIKRCSVEGSHLNNTSKGGSAELVPRSDFSSSIINDALGAALVFKRDCAGVDVIIDKNTGKHYILEVNRAPQIEHATFENEKAEWLVKAIQKTMDDHQPIKKNGKDDGIFGRFEPVVVGFPDGSREKVIAKIDTGADSSSMHATDVMVLDNVLECKIAGRSMSFTDFTDRKVRSSNGVWQHRYLVTLPVKIGKVEYDMKLTLNDRSEMNYEMLIGRRFLRTHKLLVDVGRRHITKGKANKEAK